MNDKPQAALKRVRVHNHGPFEDTLIFEFSRGGLGSDWRISWEFDWDEHHSVIARQLGELADVIAAGPPDEYETIIDHVG